MVRAWVYNEADVSDQREPHYTTPNHPITLQQLELLGIHYWHLPDTQACIDNPQHGLLGTIRGDRNYKNHDIIHVSPTTLPNYEEKIRIFFQEHLHEDEEIRYILGGSGYFDIRDELDVSGVGCKGWIRIHVFQGDMMVLPAGAYHRFTMDTKNDTKAMRLFKDAPKWEALAKNDVNAKADDRSSRHQYVDFLDKQQSKLEEIRKMGTTTGHDSNTTVHEQHSDNGTSYTLATAAQSLANYPHMRRVNGMLYVSGLSSRRLDGTHRGVSYDAQGNVIAKHIDEQTRAVIENIESILRTAGADLRHVVDATCFLVDMADYAKFNNAYNQYFSNPLVAPTRTTVAVKQLPHPNLLIEIKVVAVDPQYDERPVQRQRIN